jgi:hypothetical protein
VKQKRIPCLAQSCSAMSASLDGHWGVLSYSTLTCTSLALARCDVRLNGQMIGRPAGPMDDWLDAAVNTSN